MKSVVLCGSRRFDGTTLEIGYAVALGKPIYVLAHDDEMCRQVLFREIVPNPEELVKRLL